MGSPLASRTGNAFGEGHPTAAATVPSHAAVDGATRYGMAAVCAALMAMPFLAVRIPPITDLPQHVAQIRLLVDALHNPQTIYTVQWYTPYSLVYAVIAGAWAVFPPLQTGRMAVLALALLWTAAVHGLAARRGRSPMAATLASMLFFNLSLYWGFLNFTLGFLSFTLWFLLTARQPRDVFRWRDGAAYLAAATLLYVSHVLWLAFAIGWLLLISLVHRVPLRTAALRVASVLPVLAIVAIWYPHLAAGGFTSETVWAVPLRERVSFSWLVEGVLGGPYGSTSYLVLGTILAWCAAACWQHRSDLRSAVDPDLALLAGTCFAMALVLPDKHMNTIVFAARWLAPGMVALLLALPRPRLLEEWQSLLSLALVASFCLATTLAWMRFERDELSGLDGALEALPPSSRVLGLDFVKESAIVRGRPFLQTFAYAQVVRGGTLGFSFASFAPSLVVYREPIDFPWTIGLEWFAERIKASDFAYFDYALVNARPQLHEVLERQAPLEAVTQTGRWRLYRSKPKQP